MIPPARRRPSILTSPVVGRIRPARDAHQRRLAGAILAEQGMDFTGAYREVDVVNGAKAVKVHRHGRELKERRTG